MKNNNKIKKVFNTSLKIMEVYTVVTANPISKKIFDYSKTYFEKKYSRIIKIYDDDELSYKIYAWLEKYNAKIMRQYYSKDKRKRIYNASFIIRPEFDTFISIKTGNKVSDFDSYSRSDAALNQWALQLTLYGKNINKYLSEIEEIVELRNNVLSSFDISADSYGNGGFKCAMSSVTERNINTLFFEDSVIDPIISYIDNFLSKKDIYRKRGLLYKTGILLHGEPGTGKTSLVRALSSKYQFDIVNINLSSIDTIDLSTLTKSIDADTDKDMYIISLEDIDCLVTDREDSDKDDKKIINKLLQFLDSNSSPSNVIFIATTNHPEKLDRALTRDGRFDISIQVSGIEKSTAVKMCHSFNLSDAQINSVLYNEKYPINQSYLQGKILKEIWKEK